MGDFSLNGGDCKLYKRSSRFVGYSINGESNASRNRQNSNFTVVGRTCEAEVVM